MSKIVDLFEEFPPFPDWNHIKEYVEKQVRNSYPIDENIQDIMGYLKGTYEESYKIDFNEISEAIDKFIPNKMVNKEG